MYDARSSSSHSSGYKALDDDRMGFIRKVYGILSAQLVLTALICLIPFTSYDARMFFIRNSGLVLFFMIVGLVLICMLACVKNLARSVPTNYIILFTFTACEAYLVAYCCAVVGDPRLVLTATFMTAGIVVALTMYALTTKKDFTMCGGMLWVCLMSLIMLGLFSIFFGPAFDLVICCFGVVLFGIYLIADTQMIVGGRSHQLDKDEYVFGALMLYLDILNIFLYLLQILAILGGGGD